MKISKAISRVKSDLGITNQDDRISSRHIFAILSDIATTLTSRKLNELKIQKDYNLYRTEKVKLKKVDVVSCDIVEFKTCNSVMKSLKPLKNIIFYNGGASINMVTNLDKTIFIDKVDLRQLNRNKNRLGYDKTKPFYYVDGEGYFYIVNSNVECVEVSRLTIGVDDEDCSKLALEQEFNVPAKLEADIFNMATTVIANITKRLPKDENANLDTRS